MGKSLRHGDAFTTPPSPFSTLKTWLGNQLWVQKLDNPLGLAVLLMATLPISYILSRLDFQIGFVLFIVLAGLPLVGFVLFNLVFGMALMLFVALMVVFGAKFTGAPIGTLLDLLILLSSIGILLRQLKERDWSFAKYPLGYVILAWLYFNILQVLNPEAESKMAWLYTIRSVAIQQLVFFIGAYALKNSKAGITMLFKFIIWMCFASAVYGLKQQFIGFSAAEKAWVYADKKRFELYYQWGQMRIPSFCYDPTTFGILMACFSMLCIVLLTGPTNRTQKIWLSIMIICSMLVMAYTGTRTAYVLVPLGGVFFAGMIFNRKVLLVGGLFLLLGAGFIAKSSSSGIVFRIQSAFKPTEDDSMNLRLANQKRIQPYIQSHPMGGGLGSCGQWGERFNPDSELSKFPHDSSFVRMGVELGWIGLILYSLFHYMVLRTGLYYFIRCRDPWIKTVYAAITTWCFMLTVACYAQEAILQLPMNVIYNIFLAILVTLKNFDPAFIEIEAENAAALAALNTKPNLQISE
jgi:putative inorganic carbon (hco3(-)) transporter